MPRKARDGNGRPSYRTSIDPETTTSTEDNATGKQQQKPAKRKKKDRPAEATAGRNGQVVLPAVPKGFLCDTDTQCAEPDWIVKGAIPVNAYTLIQGRKGTAKSTLLRAIAAAMTGGPPLPHWVERPPKPVIWLGEERMWETVVKPGLIAAGADLRLVWRLPETNTKGEKHRWNMPGDEDELRVLLKAADGGLFLIDPTATIVTQGFNIGLPQPAREFGESFNNLCFEANITIVSSQHIGKDRSKHVLDQGYGNNELANCARSVLRTDDHPHRDGMRVLAVTATNIGRNMPTQLFTVDSNPAGWPFVTWHGESDLEADTIAEGRGSEAQRDAWREADLLLCAMIGKDGCDKRDIDKEAFKISLTPDMLRAAKARLKIPTPQRHGYGEKGYWKWMPPPHGWPDGLESAAEEFWVDRRIP